ncbi:7531_t:CDS:2, partial [Entrophospora sp. SA101]
MLEKHCKLHFPYGTIAHSDNSFYNKPEFSNVAVEMAESQNEEYISDETYCYSQ